MIFKNVGSQEGFTLKNQEMCLEDFGEEEIQDWLEDMFADPEEFVILTAPKAQQGVRYVQACLDEDGVEVELGIQGEGTTLYYKICSEKECCRIFLDFYADKFIPKMEEYKPVEF